ncbi:hypothetical protein K432DRAFT_377271 [Lepidopterella palustris CBS 459.81]|uniref:Uncharacterized protein n=1 Tax=Lepidopterella palustris CBS 459.81 TaxID=1314670 RepID=A0A8E2JKM1_9PEZI|nr:hypothetical protein K432DRAFT_377271 [Lepidopterella palustris CBS 459.81]
MPADREFRVACASQLLGEFSPSFASPSDQDEMSRYYMGQGNYASQLNTETVLNARERRYVLAQRHLKRLESNTTISGSTIASSGDEFGPVQRDGEFGLPVSQIDCMSLHLAESYGIQFGVRARCWDRLRVMSSQDKGETEPLDFTHDLPFVSLCITDPAIRGNPIRLHSDNFRLGPRGMKVGACMFLNLPFGSEDDCALEVLPGSDKRPRFVLQLRTELVSPVDGRRVFMLASQIDFTESFRRLAVRDRLEQDIAVEMLALVVADLDSGTDNDRVEDPSAEDPSEALAPAVVDLGSGIHEGRENPSAAESEELITGCSKSPITRF